MRHSGLLFQFIFALFIFPSCLLRPVEEKTSFSFVADSLGLELQEEGSPVYFYQKLGKSPDGQHYFNNYLHPLYSLGGDTLSEEFPEDHIHHRGIFWAWHQVYVDEQSMGDGWMMDGINQKVDTMWTRLYADRAELHTRVLWNSELASGGQPFIHECTLITTYSALDGCRIIDFEISLEALTEGVKIGGSDDEKGYGGFSARIKMPEDLLFNAAGGPLIPQTLQVEAGAWVNLSGSFGGSSVARGSGGRGVTLICHPETPNFPAPWILRQQNSMQNIVFPGRELRSIPMGSPLVLSYRMLIHTGSVGDLPRDYFEFP